MRFRRHGGSTSNGQDGMQAGATHTASVVFFSKDQDGYGNGGALNPACLQEATCWAGLGLMVARQAGASRFYRLGTCGPLPEMCRRLREEAWWLT